MTKIEIRQFPCLSDNYGFLVRDPETGVTATIDTPDAEAISREIDRFGGRLDFVLNTHHHPDHVGGNLALKSRWGASIIGPAGEAGRIPGIDRAVGDGDSVALGNRSAQVIETPGHTLGHVVYHFADDAVVFVGDTLFALGCGRLFEGSPAQMWASLKKLRDLPDDTAVYCAHEYTWANALFALSVDGKNKALLERADAIKKARAAGQPTVPTSIGVERETNPFLRAEDPSLATALGLGDETPLAVFAETRRRKDIFKG